MEILKTGFICKKCCVQSLWEDVKYMGRGNNNRSLHRDAYNENARMHHI